MELGKPCAGKPPARFDEASETKPDREALRFPPNSPLAYSTRRFYALAQDDATEYSFAMPSVILKAHYDGEHIVLDEPFVLPPNAPLAVTVLSPATPEHDAERAEWAALSAQSLARAYGDDEPEYTLADLRP
jgi:hypothetical protein